MHFAVIGGDAAGMSAASRAKRNKPDLKVTVLEKTADVSYSACGMPYNIADPDRDMDDLVVRQAKVFREKQGIDVLTGHCAETIDPAAKKVSGVNSEGKAFEIPYDKLLIATGASAVMPEVPGMDLPGVMALKSLEDGRRIKAFLETKPVRKVIIIGMGYIALEMCEALRYRNIDVVMVKSRTGFLPWMDRDMANMVQDEVQSHDVRLCPGHAAERIELSGDRLKAVFSDLILEADMVLAAVGVKPNSKIAANAGIETGVSHAIAVDRGLRTSDENIFAAGDCADAFHLVSGRKTWIPLALRANRAGWAVADNVCGGNVQLDGIVGTAVFKVFDLEVARTGLSTAEAQEAGFDPVSVTIRTNSRAHAHPGATDIWVQMTGDKKSGRLIGAQMAGREGAAHRINAAAVALHARMSAEQFAQTDLAYSPPFGPVWDPLLTAANQLLKKL